MPTLLKKNPPDTMLGGSARLAPGGKRASRSKGNGASAYRDQQTRTRIEADGAMAVPDTSSQNPPLPDALPVPPQALAPAAPTEDALTAAKILAADAARAIDAGDRSWIKVLLLTALGLAATLALGRSGWYSARDDVGYYLGLVGGLLMLSLLAYPLRKHLASFRGLGPVKYWFAVHMLVGICAPLLILLHSTFRLGSTNSAVALICMLVVAASGIVGRFLYTKVHRGLYGEKLNLEQLQATSGLVDEKMQSALHEAPAVEARLARFESYARRAYGSSLRDAWRFATIGSRRSITHLRSMREFERVVRLGGSAPAADSSDYHRRVRAADELVGSFLASAQRISQFTVYDRLLRLWHVAHVPLVYLLVITSVAHVVSVYLY